MQITRVSMFSGKTNTMEIDVTPEQIAAWKAGQLIQKAMPNLSPSEREFIMTGVTSEEWDAKFDEE